jgi:diguanylate cyclase (GGDEF)-like protein
MADPPRLHQRAIASSVLAAIALAVMLVILAALLVRGQVQARTDLRSRFALRTDLAAGFIDSLHDLGHDPTHVHEAQEISAHLATVTPVAGQRAYLVDGADRVLAASDRDAVGWTLSQAEPALGTQPSPGATPVYRGIRHPGEQVAASANVGDSGLRVVLVVPTAQLYGPLRGTVWPQWVAFGAFALLGAAAVVLLLRLMRSRAALDWALRVDPLTGVRNRRHLQERLPEVSSAAGRHGREWAVLMVDVDHFKEINDREGHAAGDAVLREVALALVGQARREDLTGRWGGDEFLVILPDTDAAGGVVVGERMADAVRARLAQHGSLSIGCAAGLGDADDLLQRADAALYEAKRQGRGRVVAAAPAAAT